MQADSLEELSMAPGKAGQGQMTKLAVKNAKSMVKFLPRSRRQLAVEGRVFS